MQALSAVFTLVLLSWSAAAESIHYVNSSSSGDCPMQPCLLLDQYIQESSKYFKTGSTFVFLPGKHFLKNPLNITTVSNISFRAEQNHSDSTIICTNAITATNVTSMDIEGLVFVLSLDLQNGTSSALVFIGSQEVAITNSVFQNGSIHSPGRAILSTDSEVTITNCLFEGNTGDNGGAIFAEEGTLMTLVGNTFTRNQAFGKGGAIYAEKSTVSLNGSTMNNFTQNSGNTSGGAIYCTESNISTWYHNTFQYNFVTGEGNSTGGAIGMDAGRIIATGSVDFTNNKAILGGAISMYQTEAELRQCSIMFKDNVARYLGGGMYANYSSFTTDGGNLTFTGNTAETMGPSEVCGVMCFYVSIYTNDTSQINNNMSATLINNSGTGGGAVFMEKTEGSVTLYDIYARDNMDGALGILYATVKCIGTSLFEMNSNHGKGVFTITGSTVTTEGIITLDHNYASAITANRSTVTFKGKTNISSNIGRLGGGGINSTKSKVIFSGTTFICNNTGHIGGGMLTERGEIEFQEESITAFSSNKATQNGGGLYASSTTITMFYKGYVTLSLNMAELGGAIYLRSNATLKFLWYSKLTTTGNNATRYGGAIYHEDVVNSVQCSNVTNIIRNSQESSASIPYSFLQFQNSPTNPRNACPRIDSHNDSAGKDGDFLYGGLLDRSRLQDTSFLSDKYLIPYDYFTSSPCRFCVSQQSDGRNAITSQPFRLINCDDNDVHFENSITVYRGQTFKLQMVALGQGKSTVETTVMALISLNARLKLNQSSQYASKECSEVTYNLYSTERYETSIPSGTMSDHRTGQYVSQSDVSTLSGCIQPV